ncbi:MAG: hypothetical protein ACW98U_09685 [Candidatus Thorarchaeota archaeon]|jgi:hypothetical protein
MRDSRVLVKEPEVTPSILADIPKVLREALADTNKIERPKRKSVLISSNSLANRFILSRWGIRPSQRRRYKTLFATVRNECRVIFQHYLLKGRVEGTVESEKLLYGIYKFDEIRGNLILGFVAMTPDSEWSLPNKT